MFAVTPGRVSRVVGVVRSVYLMLDFVALTDTCFVVLDWLDAMLVVGYGGSLVVGMVVGGVGFGHSILPRSSGSVQLGSANKK